ncbi:three-Cys-motif partner protein TcmP [Spirillospora sp. NPDC029432]|uniref:three-Cys-motif partner protein TcmP n=1 Tax=Spirillospora sp. NPDC029432 TaxID=3154599 RepID=UPI0034535F72
MATGTKGGLLGDGDQHAQSVFKHHVLQAYLRMFVAMTGSTARDKRVVVLDGFAGRGRYDSGQPASAELILQTIAELKTSRKVTSFFVEKNRADHQVLAGVIAEYAAVGMDASALPGKVEEHLEQVVTAAAGVPLFLFLDPCGAGVSFERLKGLLTGPRQPHKPQTEVLLNFSADLSRRIAGALERGRTDQQAMDTACGGVWWREVAEQARRKAPTGNFEPVVHAIAAEYARRVGAACRMNAVPIPVYREIGHQPIYHLVFFTRSPFGLWVFGDAVGQARQAWFRHLGQQRDTKLAMQGLAGLWSYGDDMQQQIDREAKWAMAHVMDNLRREVSQSGRAGFQLVDRPRQLFGSAYGIATEQTITRAARTLEAAGEVEIVAPGHRPRQMRIRKPHSGR